MRVIVGGTGDHLEMIQGVIKDCKKFGYDCMVYDFDKNLRDLAGFTDYQNFPMDFNNLPRDGGYIAKIQMKPLMILDALYKSDLDELIVYVDSDVIIQKDISQVEDFEFDVGLTFHPKDFYKNNTTESHKDKVGLLNAGVIFMRNTKESKYFVRKWLTCMMNDCKLGSDQEGLHYLVKKMNLLEPGKSVVFDGIKVMSFPALKWNCSPSRHSGKQVSAAIIAHYPGYLKNQLLLRREQLK